MDKNQSFFQVGGNLDEDAPSYIERPADAEIFTALLRGELCLVLAPRQTGKSSLMVHTRTKLLSKSIHVGVVDLQPLGSQANPAQWFIDVLFQIEDSLNLNTDTFEWWEQNQRLGPMQRFLKFLEEVVLGEIPGDVVLFFDEIDSVLKLPFADDFFTTLRSFYNARSTKPELKRLSFALLGVATASEFIKDRSRTPFNIGTPIQLSDFAPEKILGFQKVLGDDSHALINRIFFWTDGQPFLVQLLAAAIYALPTLERTPEQIDQIIEFKFFQGKLEQDTHLGFMQNYLLGDRALLRKMLKIYQQVLQGKYVAWHQQSEAQSRLRLAGVVRTQNECLKPRNRIYSRVFGQQWIEAHISRDVQRLVAYGASTSLLFMLAWVFLLQPMLFPYSPPTPHTLLRFCGSNNMGSKLIPALAEGFLKLEGYSNVFKNEGIKENESFILGELNGQVEQIEIQAHGDSTAFESLKQNQCDIGMSSRSIQPGEQQSLLPVLGDLTSNASEHVLALDALVLIVNPANPVNVLSVAQVADIFSGTLTDWAQVGGKAATINLYALNEESGTNGFFSQAVLKSHGKSLSVNAKRFESSTILSNSISNDLAGIGFVGLNHIGFNKVIALSDVGVEARKPSSLTIKTEDYVLSRRLFLYTAERPSNPNVFKFMKFALDTQSQEIVAKIGLVNLDVTPLAMNPESNYNDPRNRSIKWRSLTTGAIEIPARFRFQTGSFELDNRAHRDIGRIFYLIENKKYEGRSLILIGFSDANGIHAQGCKLSQDRVNKVKQIFEEEGVPVSHAVGLCEEAPIAPNDTPENREKNRRVEVWIK